MTTMSVAQAKGLGRYGDSELLHVSKTELRALDAMAPGGLTINPHTGQPEAFKLSKILGMALPLAAMLIPGVGPAIAAGLGGLGITGTAASALAPALLGAGGTLLGGGSLKEAALSGLLSGAGGAMFGGLGGAAGATAGAKTVGEAVANSVAPTLGGTAASAAGALGPITVDAGGQALASTAAPSLAQAAAAPAAAKAVTMKSLMPYLALGGLGLSMMPQDTGITRDETNKNPNAGKEIMDPYVVHSPGSDYRFGGSGGEFMFVDPSQTTGKFHYADGGLVDLFGGLALKPLMKAGSAGVMGILPAILNYNEPGTPASRAQDEENQRRKALGLPPLPSTSFADGGKVYDPEMFAHLFSRGPASAPTKLTGAYGDSGPATMHWTPPVGGAPAYSGGTPVVVMPKTDTPTTTPTAQFTPNIDPLLIAQSLGSPYGMMGGGGYFGPGASFAKGGMVMGPGDGSSDSVPAVIKGKHKTPAKLSNSEFVVPADVVSHLGNGSSSAGSQRLQHMVHGVRMARTGNPGMPPRV